MSKIFWQIVTVFILSCFGYIYWREEIRPESIVKECRIEAEAYAVDTYRSFILESVDRLNASTSDNLSIADKKGIVLRAKKFKEELNNGTYLVSDFNLRFNNCLNEHFVFNKKFYRKKSE